MKESYDLRILGYQERLTAAEEGKSQLEKIYAVLIKFHEEKYEFLRTTQVEMIRTTSDEKLENLRLKLDKVAASIKANRIR